LYVQVGGSVLAVSKDDFTVLWQIDDVIAFAVAVDGSVYAGRQSDEGDEEETVDDEEDEEETVDDEEDDEEDGLQDVELFCVDVFDPSGTHKRSGTLPHRHEGECHQRQWIAPSSSVRKLLFVAYSVLCC